MDIGFLQLLFRAGSGTIGLELGRTVSLLKNMGRRIISEEIISLRRKFLRIISISFQITDPQHDLLQNGGVKIIIDILSLTAVSYEIGLLQN